MSFRGTIPQGGTLPVNPEAARAQGEQWFRQQVDTRGQTPQPVAVDGSRADYAAAYNVTTGAPSGPVGVALPYGRCWAEARSITHSGGSGSVAVALVATQNGVRASVTAPAGQTITGGSVRFWVQDPVTLQWSLGAVEETLQTGAQSVSTSDQFVTVGAL